MKITLQVKGREMTFSEQELIAIVEEHISSKTTGQATTFKEMVQKPTENEWFDVKPQAIDQKLFKEDRKDIRQEATRRHIIEAFTEMKSNPKYGRNFRTMMPKKDWKSKSVEQLKEMSYKLGDHNADWVEQALEWAQRIANGESWKSICNDADTANWYRLVIWKNGYNRLVGGSVSSHNHYSASDVSGYAYSDSGILSNIVPLVVSYE